jgi:hypothetical protein
MGIFVLTSHFLWCWYYRQLPLFLPVASDGRGSLSYRERRREAHTAAEQKRRDAIKKVRNRYCRWRFMFIYIYISVIVVLPKTPGTFTPSTRIHSPYEIIQSQACPVQSSIILYIY